ncbi:unnamed protein product [Urochloa humidicola]
MVQLSSSGNRHAEPAEAAMALAQRVAAAVAVKLGVEELGDDERRPLSFLVSFPLFCCSLSFLLCDSLSTATS